ncbi:response regulator transcription factor [Burkholderia diffusa]|uniref:response regulator transcription factor n=1 Tax=Burkholderia diffusa TaxID=488732 RepID=UPI00264D1483|nr:response regulator transcription factor [Burkholderia diffusa]MDN7907513.1 response regulator transcription factor [Burkholderia diffusa]
MNIRVTLADDHPTVLSGINHELGRVPTIEIVATANSTDELVARLSGTVCDVLITDYVMPGGRVVDGLPLLKFLRRNWPDMKIVVLTTIDNPAIVQEMIKNGANAVLSKVDDIGHLIAATHAVYAGATYFSPSAQTKTPTAETLSRMAQPLTSREAEVIRLYTSGLSINEIAAQLNRSKQTISAQKIKAMKKLGIERDADLFQYAYETGLVVSGAKDGT